MYEDEVMTMQLTFDPIAERAKALSELIDTIIIPSGGDTEALVLRAMTYLVDSMAPPEPQGQDNVAQVKPTAH